VGACSVGVEVGGVVLVTVSVLVGVGGGALVTACVAGTQAVRVIIKISI
jgi:hypothetical protein